MDMKNLQKGFVVPLLLVFIAVLLVGGGVYVYENKKAEAPVVVDTETQQLNQVQPTNTPSQTITTQTSPTQTQNSFPLPSLNDCANKTDEHNKNLCYEDIAIEQLDISICDKISSSPNPNIKLFCPDAINNKLAMVKADGSYCNKINSKAAKSGCWYRLAVLKNDITICDNSGGNKDSCILQFAGKQNSLKLCELIQSSRTKATCLFTIAQNLVDPDLCGKIVGGDVSSQRDSCYESIAEKNKDETLCVKVSDTALQFGWNNRNSCYTRVAVAKNDISICANITHPQQKETCTSSLK